MASISVSAPAARHIAALVKEKGGGEGGLRVGVKGGGCSGLTYVIEWAEAPRPSDEIVEGEGARVFVDPRSAKFLEGTVLDWKTSLLQSGFVFKNPNVKGSCGCGESFSVG